MAGIRRARWNRPRKRRWEESNKCGKLRAMLNICGVRQTADWQLAWFGSEAAAIFEAMKMLQVRISHCEWRGCMQSSTRRGVTGRSRDETYIIA